MSIGKNNKQRDWDAGWSNLDATICIRDVWLLSDLIKFRYLAPRIPSGARTLEVGCGSAKLSALLAQFDPDIRTFCLDISPQGLNVAQSNFHLLDIQGTFLVGDAYRLPYPDNYFDVVFSTGLLEHYADPVTIVTEMVRVLRPGGLFFSDVVPLKFSLIRLGYYLRGYSKQTQDEYPYRGTDIRIWLSQSGLMDVRIISSGLLPPLGLIRHAPLIRELSFRLAKAWTLLDGTFISDLLGLYYLAFGIKNTP